MKIESRVLADAVIVIGNGVDLCESCKKDFVECDFSDDDMMFGDKGDNICCCKNYIPLATREEETKFEF